MDRSHTAILIPPGELPFLVVQIQVPFPAGPCNADRQPRSWRLCCARHALNRAGHGGRRAGKFRVSRTSARCRARRSGRHSAGTSKNPREDGVWVSALVGQAKAQAPSVPPPWMQQEVQAAQWAALPPYPCAFIPALGSFLRVPTSLHRRCFSGSDGAMCYSCSGPRRRAAFATGRRTADARAHSGGEGGFDAALDRAGAVGMFVRRRVQR